MNFDPIKYFSKQIEINPFNLLQKEINLRKKDSEIIDFLFYLSLAVKGKPLIQALKSCRGKGFDLIEEEFSFALQQSEKGLSLENAIEKIKQRNPESKFIEKAVDFILLGLASGANLSKLFNDTARNLMKSKQLLEERNSSLALQKYSLILIALFLMPLILGMISSIISSFDISMLSLFDENISLSEKKDSMFVIKQAILIYLIEFSFITAFFISLIENNKSKLPIYGILFAVSSLAIFSWFG